MIDWHVVVEIKMTHSFTVKAEDVYEAQNAAMQSVGERKAQHIETTIDIEQGVR